MSFIDLHIHSYYSDGFHSPNDLVKKGKSLGFSALSLTDHNGIEGVEEMMKAGKEEGIKIIPGVEIYTNFKKYHLHILGYCFRSDNPELRKVLAKLQEEKRPKIRETIALLKKDGWEIEEKEVFQCPSVYLGIGHIAGFLMKGDNLKRVKKEMNLRPRQILGMGDVIGFYFKKYFSFCSETEISADSAIELIHHAGGKAVLAHPGCQLGRKDWWVVKELKERGLDGLEAISGHHSWEQQDLWQRIAKEFGLFITCGSDYHGDLPQEWGVPFRTIWDYFRAIAEKSEIFYENSFCFS